jgi:transposase
MAERMVTDALWAEIQPLLPRRKKSSKGGAPSADDRLCLEGILYVLRGGIAWRLMPMEFPSPTTCWRRLRDWTKLGIWAKLQQILLQDLEDARRIKWSRAVIDSASVRALFGGATPDPTPPTEANPAASAI